MITLKQAADKILNECLGVKKGEKVLVITDENLKHIGQAICNAANGKLIEIPVEKGPEPEPSEDVAKEMLNYDVIIAPTKRSLTHTKAIREAAKKGARIATMPGVTEEIMQRSINVDYEEMARRTNKIKDLLDKGKKIKVTTKAGTDITFSIEEREAEASSGLVREKGGFVNSPSGETYIAPVEGTADGKIILDGSVLEKKIEKPITVIVEDGFAVNIDDNRLNRVLSKVNDKNAFNIAELGIGTNKEAIVTGNTLEDEKALGTCHFAFGNNASFGGKIDVPVHIDGILMNPTIYIDDKMIMKDGEFLS